MLLNLMLVLHLVVSVLLVIVILLQRSDGGLGALAGGSSSAMSSQGGDAAMVKLTRVLGAVFILNSLFLASLTAGSSASVSVVDNPAATEQAVPATQAPAVPVVPVVPESAE